MARQVDAEVVVVGAGIVGLATARALHRRQPSWRIVVLDKEPSVGVHQSSHNSGVVHAGVYDRPGSSRARLCAQGRQELLALCAEHGLPHRVCGKVIVATRPEELDRLARLEARARANGVVVQRLDAAGVRRLEPHVAGRAGLWVPSTAVVDFPAVTRALAAELAAGGAVLALGQPVVAVREDDTGVEVRTGDVAGRPGGRWRARALVGCAGLHADRLARAAGLRPGLRTVPFRGEYHELAPDRRHLVRGLVYPVPDPAMPFLGVHLTRGIDGVVHVGPNAVLALGREAYRWSRSRPAGMAELAVDPALWRLGRRHARAGATELIRSLSRRRLLAAARRLLPELEIDDLVTAPAGIRAQAVDDQGRLLDDFAFASTARSVHVLNAPSPAATASLAIGAAVADRLLASLDAM